MDTTAALLLLLFCVHLRCRVTSAPDTDSVSLLLLIFCCCVLLLHFVWIKMYINIVNLLFEIVHDLSCHPIASLKRGTTKTMQNKYPVVERRRTREDGSSWVELRGRGVFVSVPCWRHDVCSVSWRLTMRTHSHWLLLVDRHNIHIWSRACRLRTEPSTSLFSNNK